MKRIHIVGDCLEYARAYGFDGTDNDKSIAYLSLKTKMYNDAIYNDGICKTFIFSENCHDPILDYIKIEDKDIELYPDMFEIRFEAKGIISSSKTDQGTEYKDILGSCLMYNETDEIDDKLKHVFEEIKEECVKKHNTVYSTVMIYKINIYESTETIFIHYSYYRIKDEFIDKINSDDVIFGKAPLPYGEWFDFDSHSTDDSSRKVGIALTKDVEAALNKGYIDCTAPAPVNNAIRYCSSDAMISELLLKENKNMRMIVHLLIVPKGMSEEFVNNTKKNLQSDDEAALYVSSNDIAFEPHDKYKTKYDLFEYWVKSGLIHCVEFMVGYESDPEAKAFEAFIRGILINSASVDTVNLWYQKDTIERAVNNLRSDYNKSSIIRSNLNSITDTIMDKVKVFKEYGLKDADLDIIRNADCDRKDAYNATVDKITDIAFASDKKGSKGNKK